MSYLFLKRVIAGSVLTLLVNVCAGQSVTLTEIEHAWKSGDAAALSEHFGNSIDISFNQTQNTYSKTQASMVLKDFFRKNEVQNFSLRYTGNSTASNILFCVGSLNTTSGNFKIYMYLREQPEARPILREIRIMK